MEQPKAVEYGSPKASPEVLKQRIYIYIYIYIFSYLTFMLPIATVTLPLPSFPFSAVKSVIAG